MCYLHCWKGEACQNVLFSFFFRRGFFALLKETSRITRINYNLSGIIIKKNPCNPRHPRLKNEMRLFGQSPMAVTTAL